MSEVCDQSLLNKSGTKLDTRQSSEADNLVYHKKQSSALAEEWSSDFGDGMESIRCPGRQSWVMI